MIINFAKTKENGVIPTKRKEDAGYDVYACFEENYLIINPLETKLIPTGIASAMSNGWYLQVEERGSTGTKGIKKSAGIIDSGYRGEIFIALTNCNNKPILITKEKDTEYLEDDYIVYPYTKAIAQLILHKVYDSEVKEMSYEELKNISSERGIGSLGSSNK